MMSTKIINSSKKPQKEEGWKQYITDIFIFGVLCVFPLVYHNMYFDILETKYYFYCGCVIFLILGLGFYAMMNLESVRRYVLTFDKRQFLKRFRIEDIALLVFLSVAALSTLCSEYLYESFWGNEGRYCGLFLLSLYGAAYFCVTRHGKFKSWYLDAFLAAAMLMCLFGITDYFKMDLLHFKELMDPKQVNSFASTIGNINTYTACVAMVAAVSATLFITIHEMKRTVFYFICMVISFFALIMGVSDNAYLSLAVLFGLLPLCVFGRKTGVRRYLMMIASFLTVAEVIRRINEAMAGRVIGINSIFNMIAEYKHLIPVIIGLWVVAGTWYLLDWITKNKKDEKTTYLQYIWLLLLIIAAAGLIYALYDCNVKGNKDSYGRLSQLLFFDDSWGTHRGYIWRNSMEAFQEFSPFKKIIGFGPDTYKMVLYERTAYNPYGEVFDSAHNEYLHYLITVGIAGLVAYLFFLASFIFKVAKYAAKAPYLMAVLFAVLCYCTQAFVNINLPIATPIMWTLLTLGVLGYRQHQSKKDEI